MDAPSFNGPDDRDLSRPHLEDQCPDCGALWNEDCDPECPCSFCLDRRARLAAKRYMAHETRVLDPEYVEVLKLKGML